MSDVPDGLVLRDTIVASAVGSGQTSTFQFPEWAKAARVIAQGGDAARPDGTSGDGGYVMIELYGDPEEQP